MNTTLEYLNLFHPCNGALVVGSGNGSWVNLLASWDAQDVILAEADEKLIERMKKFHTLPRKWKVVNALVYKDQTQCEYYHTSNPVESGLEHPDTLSAVWPNLSINSVEVRESVSIPTLLEQVDAQNINWLIIDCTPALKLLQEGVSTLEQCDVVVARVLKEEKSALDAWMQEQGLHSATFFEENNPQVVMVVYVKEWHTELSVMRTTNANLIESAEGLDETTRQLQEQIKHKEEQLTQLQKQSKETIEELGQKLNELTASHESNKSLEEQLLNLKTSQEQLAKEREEHITKINALIQRRDILVKENTSLIEKQKVLEEKVDFLSDAKIEQLVNECMEAEDIFEVLDKYLLEDIFPDNKKFELICSVAIKVGTTIDRTQGVGLLNQARLFISKENHIASKQYENLSHLGTILNQLDLSVDMLIESMALADTIYTKKIANGYTKIRSLSQKNQQHGHDLLIDYIVKNIPKNEIGDKLLIEIGTTRENVPGQGSTEQIAKLCKEKNIKFVTVDMDPHNTRWANFVSQKKELEFKAVTAKGEDYLKNEADGFDFVFLDAYDFDHGKHSELRQTRYEKNLGSKIDETECHIMHLKCAYSVEAKLREGGVVCIDDTWQDEDGNWTAKGTLAVPYLLSKGFKIVEARNNAVLLFRG